MQIDHSASACSPPLFLLCAGGALAFLFPSSAAVLSPFRFGVKGGGTNIPELARTQMIEPHRLWKRRSGVPCRSELAGAISELRPSPARRETKTGEPVRRGTAP